MGMGTRGGHQGWEPGEDPEAAAVGLWRRPGAAGQRMWGGVRGVGVSGAEVVIGPLEPVVGPLVGTVGPWGGLPHGAVAGEVM